MKLKTGTKTRRKILALLLTAALAFSLLPAVVPAAEGGGVTLIPSGDYTISANGAYRLTNGYSGLITIARGAYGVTVIGSADGKTHPATSIIVSERPKPLQLIIEDLKLIAPEGKPGIDFGNAPGFSYIKWPYNQNNVQQPAPYSLTNLLRIGGDCSVTGGRDRAGVYVGEGVRLTIDKAPGRTDAQARLAAVGGEQGTGIGGDRGFSGGSVTIDGGTITATGGTQGAGLGGLVGAIIINGGTVTATGGPHAPGLGNTMTAMSRTFEKYNLSAATIMQDSSFVIPGETIIINGGTVTAVGNSESGISAMGGLRSFQYMSVPKMMLGNRKHNLGRLTVNGGSVTARGSSGMNMLPGISGKQIEINAGVVSAVSDNGPGISGFTTIINGGTVLASGGSSPNEFLEFMNNGLDQFKDMTNSSEIPEGASEALNDMMRSMADMFFSELFGPSGSGAGISLWPEDSLTINDGIVIARGGPSSAGIGGSVMGGLGGLFVGSMNIDFTPGPITINGGLVSATGGIGGAGIGGGYKQEAKRITISGNPTVIATRGSDGAQDIGSGEGGSLTGTLLKDPWGKDLSYLRLEVKNKTTHQPLPNKKVMVNDAAYFTNKDGLLGFFAPRTREVSSGRKDYSLRTPAKIMVTALASSAFPGAVTEIIPSEQNIRAAIDLDFYLQNVALQGISEDNANGVLLQPTSTFDPQQANYALDVENKVTSLKVIPERVAGDTVTAIQVNGSQVQPGEAEVIPLQIGENNILVTVTLPAEEWAAGAFPLKKEYFMKVNRANMTLPNLILWESNQPLDEGGVFRARYALLLPTRVTIMENQSAGIERTGPAPDPGYDGKPVGLAGSPWPLTWRGTVDYGDGSGLQAIDLREDGSFDLEHRYGMGGDYPVKIALAYENSGLVTDNRSVKVNYVAPQLLGADIAGEPFEEGGVRVDKSVDINEGALLVLEGTVADPGDNRWTVTLDSHDTLGPLEVPLRADKTFTVGKTIYDPESVSIGKGRFYRPAFHYLDLLVRDNTGLTGTRRLKVNVKNVAPFVEVHGTPLAQREVAFSGAGSFSDPGRDRWQATVDYGDGGGSQALSLNADKTFSLYHVYLQSGNFTVTVRVEDQDGGVGTASFPVKVKDYLFALEAGADTSINEGAALERIIPMRGPRAKVQSITVDYGDGSAVETLALGPVNQSGKQKMSEVKASGQLNLNHTYKDNGEYTVTVKLTDTDQDVYEESFGVKAANVAPVVSIKSDDKYTTRETFTCSGSLTDPGSDVWTAVIDFGDGDGVRELRLNDDKTFSVSHSYNSSGSYTIAVTVSDDDGGVGQANQLVSVRSKGSSISSDASLNSLVGIPNLQQNDGVHAGNGFISDCLVYTCTGAFMATQIEVTAHLGATIKYTDAGVTDVALAQNTLTLVNVGVGDTLKIKVTAQDGATTREYIIVHV